MKVVSASNPRVFLIGGDGTRPKGSDDPWRRPSSRNVFHFLRSCHKWVGVVASLFLLLVGMTGLLLATKSWLGVIRPPEVKSEHKADPARTASMDVVVASVFAVGLEEIRTLKDIDRIDYRPKSNMFKVLSKKGFREVQVDGRTGRVLQVALRNDHFIEKVHDLSIFHEVLNTFALPLVALSLCGLAGTGVYMFFVPVLRRRRYARQVAAKKEVS